MLSFFNIKDRTLKGMDPIIIIKVLGPKGIWLSVDAEYFRIKGGYIYVLMADSVNIRGNGHFSGNIKQDWGCFLGKRAAIMAACFPF